MFTIKSFHVYVLPLDVLLLILTLVPKLKTSTQHLLLHTLRPVLMILMMLTLVV